MKAVVAGTRTKSSADGKSAPPKMAEFANAAVSPANSATEVSSVIGSTNFDSVPLRSFSAQFWYGLTEDDVSSRVEEMVKVLGD